MPSFLKDISAFYGDNGRNPRGDNLEEFLEKYNHGDYETPAVTADNLIFRMKQEGKPVPGNLELLMIRGGKGALGGDLSDRNPAGAVKLCGRGGPGSEMADCNHCIPCAGGAGSVGRSGLG